MNAGQMVPNDTPWSPLDGYTYDKKNSVKLSGSSEFFPDPGTGTYIPYTSQHVYEVQSNGYSAANALAVTASSVAGTWTSAGGTSFTIAVDGGVGTITGGTYLGGQQTCNVTGTIRLREPTSSKNLYDIEFTVNDLGNSAPYECDIPNNSHPKGLAAINFLNIGTHLAPVYAYNLELAVFEADKVALSDVLLKQ